MGPPNPARPTRPSASLFRASSAPLPLRAFPGTSELEQFDNGGADVAYHDATSGNSGGEYRTTDVDLQTTADAGGGYNVGWVSVGEWLNYTVTVAAAGTNAIDVRVASPGAGGTFHLEANGVDKTGPMRVPDTGDWQAWTTVSRAGVALAAGRQTLRLVIDAVGSSGWIGNFNWLRVR